jgi:hypothetical protein
VAIPDPASRPAPTPSAESESAPGLPDVRP